MTTANSIFINLIQKGMQLWAENGELCLYGSKGALSPADREQLTTHKQDILRLLMPGKKYRLPSFAQQRLWFIDQLEPENTAYNIFSAVRLHGALNVAALEQSFQHIV